MGHLHPHLDFAAYLDWEEQQETRNEYYGGEIVAMTSARRAHVTVALNLASAFKAHLRGGPCRAYISDMMLRIEAADAVFYPDVMVTCDPRDHQAERFLEHPRLLVEVLSDSTAAWDRGEKFAAYRRIDSLAEYALVDVDSCRVECFRRDATGHWVLYEFAGDDACEFASIELRLPLAAVFEAAEPPVQANA